MGLCKHFICAMMVYESLTLSLMPPCLMPQRSAYMYIPVRLGLEQVGLEYVCDLIDKLLICRAWQRLERDCQFS